VSAKGWKAWWWCLIVCGLFVAAHGGYVAHLCVARGLLGSAVISSIMALGALVVPPVGAYVDLRK